MLEKEIDQSCCSPIETATGCCRVEAIIGVDERGQMILPKELRERVNIRAGDKMAVISMQRKGQTCCLTLIKAEELAGTVKGMLGPVFEEVLNEKG